jgi:hypothetical protein
MYPAAGIARYPFVSLFADPRHLPIFKHVHSLVLRSFQTARRFPKDGRDGDEQAAYAVAAWLQRADLNGSLGSFLKPPLTPEEREVAAVEGWILGVV